MQGALQVCPSNIERMKLSSVLTAAASTLAVATIGYAVYFDYKRRNDPDFRKKLRKQSKQSVKVAKKELKAAAQQESMIIDRAVRDAAEPGVLPAGVQEKEAFFMEQVATGEALFAQGSAYHVPAAIAFFKALKVYPAPVELVMIYQKAVPKEVFDLIMKLVTRDAAVNGAGGASAKSADLDQVDDAVDEKEPSQQKDSSEAKSETTSSKAAGPQNGATKEEEIKGEKEEKTPQTGAETA